MKCVSTNIVRGNVMAMDRIINEEDVYPELERWINSRGNPSSPPFYYWDYYDNGKSYLNLALDHESIALRSLARDGIRKTADPDFYHSVEFALENAVKQYRSDEAKELEDLFNLIKEKKKEVKYVADFVFESGRGEHFENGVETHFSNGIEMFIRQYHVLAIDVIQTACIYLADRFPPIYREYLCAEALFWVGDLEDRCTEVRRRALLESALWATTISLQDAAVSALSYMGSWQSIEPLEARKKACHEVHDRALLTNINSVLKYAYKLQEKHEDRPAVAQLEERHFCNLGVVGSNPTSGSLTKLTGGVMVK